MTPAPRRRGRPRAPDTDQRILDATLRLLGKDGFARMSVDAIATEAGVTKPTIYLRFRNKAELARAALTSLAAARDRSAPSVTGDVRTDLVAQLEHFRQGVSRPFGVSLVGTVLAEEHETPDLLALYRELIVLPRRTMLRATLQRARDQGDIRPDVDVEEAVNALIGAFYARYLTGADFPNDWERRIVDTVLNGVRG
jgi:AcrR family transcriptional regulator